MGGPTVQSLSQLNQLNQQNLDQIRSNNLYNVRQQAAQQASQLYQQGRPLNEVYGVLMQADPAWAEKFAPQLSQIDPDLAAQATGKKEQAVSDVLSQTKSMPGQIAETNKEGKLAAAEARLQYMQDQLKHYTLAGGQDAFATKGSLQAQARANGGVVVPSGQTGAATLPSGEANPLAGIGKNDQKEVKKMSASLNTAPDMKDFNTELYGLQQAKDLADGNLPNSQVPLAMKFFTSSEFVKRFNEAEFNQGPIKAKAVVDKVRNALAEGTQGNLDPTVMQDFQNIMDNMFHSTLNEYQGALEQRASQLETSTQGRLPKDKALQVLVKDSNPLFAQRALIYNKLSPEDRNMVDKARQHLTAPGAMALLKHFGL